MSDKKEIPLEEKYQRALEDARTAWGVVASKDAIIARLNQDVDKLISQLEPSLAGAENEEIDDCPFCGVVGSVWNVFNTEWICGCRNDSCHIMPQTKGMHRKDSIEQWNKRAS